METIFTSDPKQRLVVSCVRNTFGAKLAWTRTEGLTHSAILSGPSSDAAARDIAHTADDPDPPAFARGL